LPSGVYSAVDFIKSALPPTLAVLGLPFGSYSNEYTTFSEDVAFFMLCLSSYLYEKLFPFGFIVSIKSLFLYLNVDSFLAISDTFCKLPSSSYL